MKIKSKRKCFTPTMGLVWQAGEIKELSSETAKLLLEDSNFSEIKESENEYNTREMKSKGRNYKNNNLEN